MSSQNISYPHQRVAILIDTANLYHTAKIAYRSKVHFKNLISEVLYQRTLVRAIAYTITSDSGEETAFIQTLSSEGIEIKSKPLITYRQGNQKADWDVGITVDAISLIPKIDALILVSGDSDFVPLAHYARSHGVAFEVAAFSESASNRLLEVADTHHNLSDMTASILIHQKKRKK